MDDDDLAAASYRMRDVISSAMLMSRRFHQVIALLHSIECLWPRNIQFPSAVAGRNFASQSEIGVLPESSQKSWRGSRNKTRSLSKITCMPIEEKRDSKMHTIVFDWARKESRVASRCRTWRRWITVVLLADKRSGYMKHTGS